MQLEQLSLSQKHLRSYTYSIESSSRDRHHGSLASTSTKALKASQCCQWYELCSGLANQNSPDLVGGEGLLRCLRRTTTIRCVERLFLLRTIRLVLSSSVYLLLSEDQLSSTLCRSAYPTLHQVLSPGDGISSPGSEVDHGPLLIRPMKMWRSRVNIVEHFFWTSILCRQSHALACRGIENSDCLCTNTAVMLLLPNVRPRSSRNRVQPGKRDRTSPPTTTLLRIDNRSAIDLTMLYCRFWRS